jgi:hypothetical protein
VAADMTPTPIASDTTLPVASDTTAPHVASGFSRKDSEHKR